jgi:predicted TIM-barrel fold metal-dependent hydrolase
LGPIWSMEAQLPQVDPIDRDYDSRPGDGLPEGGVIDACAYPSWPGTQALTEYMAEPWKELLLRPGDRLGPVSVLSPRLYVDPRRLDSMEYKLADLKKGLVTDGVRERVVLGWDDGLYSTVLPYQQIVRTVIQAANDWLIDQCLSRDRAFYGTMLISSAMPTAAAAEIRRIGVNERIVAVALGCNGLGRPFGDSIYLPIFEAAAEMQLPVVLQLGSDATTDQVTPPVAGGPPATYAEYLALGVHSHMSHLASMIVDGLFERFPDLKVMLVGSGFAWVPSWLWRLNLWVKRGKRSQAPWLTRLPTDYFVDHVRVTTESLESPRPAEQFDRVLNAISGLERTLMYASGYPVTESDDPISLSTRLPPSWRAPVLRNNALTFFRWAAQPANVAVNASPTSTEGREP